MAETFAQRRNAVYGRRHGKLKVVPVGSCQLRGSARKGIRPTLAHCAGQVKHHGNAEAINNRFSVIAYELDSAAGGTQEVPPRTRAHAPSGYRPYRVTAP